MLPRGAALLALLAGLLWAPPAAAQLQLPRPTGYVNDFADVIPAEQEAAIDAVIQEVRAKSGGEIAVVTLPSLEGRPPSEVSLQVLREWGVGASGQPGDSLANTGTVVMVAPREREARIELGYATNTFITAAESGRILDQYMVPHFRQGDYGTGILEGVRAVGQQYAARFGFQLTGQVPGAAAPGAPVQRPVSGGGGGRILFYVILAFFIFSFFRRGGGGGGGGGRRRRYGGPIILPFP
ncbi:MAG: TPM domain-containing protein, partial [Gemmatimonadota bacterium]